MIPFGSLLPPYREAPMGLFHKMNKDVVPPLPTPRPLFQTTKDKGADRSDHIWFVCISGQYKCCLCGAMTDSPPNFPTPEGWMPDEYELPLSDAERALCPYLGKKI